MRLMSQAELWAPAAIGGILDYVNQLQRGSKNWNFTGFFVHLFSAIFFGWVTGMLAGGFDYDAQIIAAAGGIGGFLGVRIADLIVLAANRFK